MAREPLRVRRLDSPLARPGTETPAATDGQPPLETEHEVGGNEQAALQVPAPIEANGGEPEEPVDRQGIGERSAGDLPSPPPLDEQLEFVSGRVPGSLAQRLNAMTLALRERQRSRASQKGLPQQEVLAVLLWALGDSDDPRAVEALAELHARYRAGRYTAAAEQLISS